MRHTWITLAVIAWTGATSGLALAESPSTFRGLFEGIDPEDGSFMQCQITCTNSGSTCTVLCADTFFSFCPDADGRGILRGDGRIADRDLVVPDFTLTCADGSSFSAESTFTPDSRNQALMVPNDDPETPPLTLHRVNTPLRLR